MLLVAAFSKEIGSYAHMVLSKNLLEDFLQANLQPCKCTPRIQAQRPAHLDSTSSITCGAIMIFQTLRSGAALWQLILQHIQKGLTIGRSDIF